MAFSSFEALWRYQRNEEQVLLNLFIDEMNVKAKQIGLTHSHFIEPAGFPSDIDHVMSTRDMVKMMIHASRYQALSNIWSEKSYTFTVEGENSREMTINTTVALPEIEHDYEIFGGKTGCIWGTNVIDGYHLLLMTNAPNDKKFIAAIRGASTEEERAHDLKTALDHAKTLLLHPNETVGTIASASVAVSLLPIDGALPDDQGDLPLIYSKNPDLPGHPASITKIMTAITALDYIKNLDEKIVLEEADMTPGMGNFFHPGDIISFRDALYSMMLPSSNTSATAIARVVGEKIYQKTRR